MVDKKIAIASDHGGYDLKEVIISYLKSEKWEVEDLGTFGRDSVDYPDFGVLVVEKVKNNDCKYGILICGTGIGMSIVANRFPGVRAALCLNCYMARMAREHNDANILVLGGRVLGSELAVEIVKTFINSNFSFGENHIRRLEKINKLNIY